MKVVLRVLVGIGGASFEGDQKIGIELLKKHKAKSREYEIKCKKPSKFV